MLDVLLTIFKMFAPLLKTRTGLYFLAFTLIITGSFYGGYHYRGLIAEKEKSEAVQLAIMQSNEQASIDNEILSDSVEIQTKIRTVFKYIEKEVPNVKVDNCNDLGDDWVRVYNDAAREAAKATSN